MSAPEKGDRAFHVWLGPFSGTVWAGTMRFNGEQWEATGKKHDVTDDIAGLFADPDAREMLGARTHRIEMDSGDSQGTHQ